MTTVKKENKDEIDVLLHELEHGYSEIARYDAEAQKRMNLILLLISIVFTYGYKENIQEIFLAIPLGVLYLAQYMWNTIYGFLYGKIMLWPLRNESTYFFLLNC